MKVSTLAVLLLVCSFAALASSKPAQKERETQEVHEEVRKRWNDAKKLVRRLPRPRARRSVRKPSDNCVPGAPTPQVDQLDSGLAVTLAGNASVTRYIVDLYNSISSNTCMERTQANTVRSLQNVAPVPQCDVFNFSLSDIGDKEYIIKAELRLYMTRRETTPPQPNTPFYVVIRKFRKSENEPSDYVTAMEILPSQEPGWTKFELQHEISKLVPKDESHAVFKVHIYQDIQSYVSKQDNHLDCTNSPISFAYAPSEEDKVPYLVVHSYDRRVDQIDFNAIWNSESMAKQANTRGRRNSISTDDVPTCRVNDLEVSTSRIPPGDLDGQIIYPHKWNAGICGGSCGNTAPQLSTHSQLIHHLIYSNEFQRPNYGSYVYEFKQCCAPVSYKTLAAVFQPKNEAFKMVMFPSLEITECECLEVVEYVKSRDILGK